MQDLLSNFCITAIGLLIGKIAVGIVGEDALKLSGVVNSYLKDKLVCGCWRSKLRFTLVNHCPLKEAAFDNKFCSPIEGSQSLLDWASLGR